ncbi:pantetheine-phosphate adenylyltransferase [Pleomorphomonas koreensis]|jgi:pantetheine-phosphate adenylyltransferase|uniref:pantetheine-phosphate adenylyltransferase n=1 Tax=Pleomorphomonas koreensis TaxID=257440 RepID=UPI0004007043|nr:pantetheine-phosphate adenylyltransferase [Pleomorphomonas koreensis]
MTTALYAGSFDPATYGHLDVIERASRLFGTLVVAIGIHHEKKGEFDAAEREAMLRELVVPIAGRTGGRIEVVTFADLVVDIARRHGARVLVRGIRNSSDLDVEVGMAGMNAVLAPEIDTIYFGASSGVRHVASSLVKQIARLGGDITAFVPPQVADKLRARYPAG